MNDTSTMPTNEASMISAGLPVLIRVKKTKAHTAPPMPPIISTGRRPMRSASSPAIGINRICATAPSSTALSAMLLGRPSLVGTKYSRNSVNT
ncbi:hypothetical protein D3C72_1221130 [compost metagenome]